MRSSINVVRYTIWGLAISAGNGALAAQLPIPCAVGSCGPGNSSWVASGAATATVSANTLRINQTSNQATLNWANFDISADGNVVFQQPSSSSIALNRIFSQSPSSIFGHIEANGQVYLVNPNGFIFGSSSTVNAAGILASTLKISDATFAAGLLSPSILAGGNAALAADGTDLNGNPLVGLNGQPIAVNLIVEQGAQLSTNVAGGRVLLAAQNVSNSGTITANDGQVAIAAGQKVYLQASSDPALRGLLIEVDGGGTAANTLTGSLNSAHGAITMVGLAVNQDGRISATTSVNANGSVQLLARDSVSIQPGAGGTPVLSAQQGGKLTLGSTSSIQVLPDLADTHTAVDEQTQLPSSVELSGGQIFLRSGSSIVATGGDITASTVRTPASFSPGGLPLYDSSSQIHVESGAVLDVSGSDLTLPMSSNFVTVQLRASELANFPIQQNGPLHGQTVVVDTRASGTNADGTQWVGTPLADVSADIAAIPKTIAQRTSAGGSIVFDSNGDLVVAKGATINVSGGVTTYTGGAVSSSKLITATGQLIDIANADPNATYVGVASPSTSVTHDTWGVIQNFPTPAASLFAPGYVQGSSAGSVQFAAPRMALNPILLGNTVAGPFQRTLATAPAGGQLIIGSPNGQGLVQPDYQAPSVVFTDAPPTVVVADGASFPGPVSLFLSTDYLKNGFSAEIFSNGNVTLPAGLDLTLAVGGQLAITARSIDIFSNVTAPGGAISFNSVLTPGIAGLTLPETGVAVGAGVALDVRGTWTNDALAPASVTPTGITAVNGGTITLGVAPAPGQDTLTIGDDVQLHASGGAWLQQNGSLVSGAGGNIHIAAPPTAALEIGSGIGIDGFGVRGAAGGNFSFEASRIEVGSGSAWLAPLADDVNGNTRLPVMLGAGLFSNYGFSSLTLTANALSPATGSPDVLTVMGGTDVIARTESLSLNPLQFQSEVSSANISAFSQPITLPVATRPVTNVTLNAVPKDVTGSAQLADGRISIQAGAVLEGDPTAKITVSSVGGIALDGTIAAPAGSIVLAIPKPPDGFDVGYRPDLQISVGASGIVDASGIRVLNPTDAEPLAGQVLGGGSVQLNAQRGSVNLAPGSVINVSGGAAPIDVLAPNGQGFIVETIGSAGGSLSVVASEGIGLNGSINAFAGIGQAGTGTPAAGSLSLQLTRAVSDPGLLATFPQGPRVIEVATPGSFSSNPPNGLAEIDAGLIKSSGIDALTLIADNLVEFQASQSIALSRSLVVDAPQIGIVGSGNVALAAPYVSLGNPGEFGAAGTATPGAGQLTVSSTRLDLVGTVTTQGIGAVTLGATGDIQLIGFQSTATGTSGMFSVDGNLNLSANRVYASTNTQFTLQAVDANSGGTPSTLRVDQVGGASIGTPLSAGGGITLAADNIVQNGSLYAPFGTIALDASTSLILGPGSLTSVSGNGLEIPYGTVVNGTTWQYGSGADVITQIPGRQVSLNAPTVTSAPGSKIDISGGGDLYAYEFVPGTGGTIDRLQPGAVAGLYAILPALRGQFAPFDPQNDSGSSLQPGDSVYLSGGAGLAAGVYPLLPATYGLLPGAFYVTVVAGTTGMPAGSVAQLPDGTPVISGYQTFGNTGLGAPLYSGFAIRPGSYGKTLADYEDHLASSFFAAAAAASGAPRPSLPADAGKLTIVVDTSLNLAGSVATSAANGGIGGKVELAAPLLEVTGSGMADPIPGAVTISDAVLTGWNPAEVLLGGQRSADGSSLSVTSNVVTISGGAKLAFDDLTVVANQSISVDDGSILASTSGITGKAPPALGNVIPNLLSVSGGNAAAAVLSLSDLTLTGVANTAANGAAGASVNVDASSELVTRGALFLDAPGGASVLGALQGAGANVTLASDRVVFGGTPVDNPNALVIGAGLLQSLQQVRSLTIASAGSIDFTVPTELGVAGSGGASISSLTISAGQLRNLSPGSDVALGGGQVFIEGLSSATAPSLSSAGAGSLSFQGNSIAIDNGNISISGFARTNFMSSGDLVVGGTLNLNAQGDISVAANRVNVAGGAQASLVSSGALTIAGPAGSGGIQTSLQPGGSLSLSADSVQLLGTIAAPSGAVQIASNSDLTLGATAQIDTSGMLVSAAGKNVGTPGGDISLAAGGSLDLMPGSLLAVSGSSGANAGSVTLFAQQGSTVGATLEGAATGSGLGGSFTLQSAQLTDFGDLLQRLQNGGFTQSQAIHVAAGDLILQSGATVSARNISWSTDSGTIEVAGAIDAPGGALRSSVQLSAGTAVIVDGSAQIRADTTAANSAGGSILLATTGQDIRVLPGAVISARGSTNGDLTIRAPASSNDIAVSALDGDFSGLAHVVLEPVVSQTIADGTGLDLTSILTATSNFMAQAGPNIASRFAAVSAPLIVRPTAQILSQGDVTLNSIDLSAWRVGTDGQPIDLTVRAAGSLSISGTLSDGFGSFTAGNSTYTDLLGGPSASMSFVAGANLSAADVLSTGTNAANLTLSNGALLRTGTGNITLAASQDVLFQSGASVYTGGIAGAPSQAPGTFNNTGSYAFPTGGGSISLLAGRDVVGVPVAQNITAWQQRQGNNGRGQATQWGIDFDQFHWTLGSLGGGDVSVRAGRDILNVAAADADSGIVSSAQQLTEYGGGNLQMVAGRDIDSPMAYVAEGQGTLLAGRSIGSDRADKFGNSLGAFLAADDSPLTLQARGDIIIENEVNPQVLPQTNEGRQQTTFFFTYGPDSSLTASSIAGSVTLYTSATRLSGFLGPLGTSASLAVPASMLPASLTINAFSGDIRIAGSSVLFPSDTGQLALFAGHDIESFSGVGAISMSDAPAALIPTALSPLSTTFTSQQATQLDSSGESGRHIGDLVSASISAGEDIQGQLTFSLAKPVVVSAGRDIINTSLIGQNLRPGDVTEILAGRDFVQPENALAANIQIGGPGTFDLIAGRQVDLGFSKGITTVGSLLDPELSTANGADIAVIAGVSGPLDSSDFLAKIVGTSAQDQALLASYVESQTGQTQLPYQAAAAEFLNLSADQQRPFLLSTFFSELVDSGRAANANPTVGFTRGYSAINALFPGSNAGVASPSTANPYVGDVSLAFSRIYTLAGGTISILAPGGLLDVGLATPPTNVPSRDPSQLGIVAQGKGDVDIFTLGDVLVNESRVFTLGGGNIAIWSTLGNIDAGRGAKSSISAPPPTVSVDSQGNVSLDFSGAVAGSGIRTIINSDDATPGNVDLIAPQGFVNAGDAGIGSSGNLNIAAQKVIGIDNIQVGGISTGVPPAVSGIGANLAGAASASSSASNASTSGVNAEQAARETAAPLAQSAMTWLDVFVTGLGEDACKPEDAECLRRQKLH